ncbi:MAG: TIGR04283 family arsenosugar biosynthesis glycosyltransferase [Elainellaceae cyanobacterium]
MHRCSIIIPTLNEEICIGQTLAALTQLQPLPLEIIVVDGGSVDDTKVAIAQQVKCASIPIELIETFPGRAVQMNAGAAVAKGDALCFLHADTGVPPDVVWLIDHVLQEAGVAGGGFISLMQGQATTRWGTSLHNYLKTFYAPLLFRPHLFLRGLRLLFGDQVMFCRRSAFLACGGFDPAMPIMEDGDLCRRLVRQGRLRLVNRVVYSSDRRVAKWGPLRANLIFLMIGFLWGFGAPAHWLKQLYKDVR